ncbi:protein RETICULATA-RELATED 4 [Cucumis melo var. makuwa]|uniref:Protein RETICULATA-RELATED 4 n=1 Tax=Cucumis melo var. makuwa TaxID=1194695 RepID=A0A5D3BJ78_CUCMM|nr:protein RETICULATA-RELATED 4 [Cucumis melo var. makuwa]
MAIRNFSNLSIPPPFLSPSPPTPNFTYILTSPTHSPPSLRLAPTTSPLRPRRTLRISLAFASSDGTIPPGGHGSGGGGHGHGDGGEEEEEEDREKNRAEAIAVLAEAGRSIESLPKDLAGAIAAGRVPAVIVERFLELEKSAALRWLMQFGGFKERVLADDLFLAKVAMECGVGIFTKIMAIVADFMLVWLPAPTVSLKPALAISAGPLTKFFYGCPENAFQVALAGTSFSFLQRVGAVVRNGAKLFAVGSGASVVGTGITNTLINIRKFFDKSYAMEAEDVPVLATSIGYGVYMSVSSNLRYQIIAGVIEQRMLEPLLHKHKLALSAICFAVRTGNTFLGSLMWVDFARWTGIQRTRE